MLRASFFRFQDPLQKSAQLREESPESTHTEGGRVVVVQICPIGKDGNPPGQLFSQGAFHPALVLL